MRKAWVIGVAGGSGSGKTTFARRLSEALGSVPSKILSQDSYYIDQSEKFDGDGGSVNFDHPDSIEFSLLADHIRALKRGESVQCPQYDFATHSRLDESILMEPTPVVIVDGTLLGSCDDVVSELDVFVFLDVPDSVRFARRLKRDVEQRGRTPEGVRAQYESQVKPMYDLYVAPSVHKASSVLVHGQEWMPLIQDLVQQVSDIFSVRTE